MNMLIQHTGITGLGSITEQELLQRSGSGSFLLISLVHHSSFFKC